MMKWLLVVMVLSLFLVVSCEEYLGVDDIDEEYEYLEDEIVNEGSENIAGQGYRFTRRVRRTKPRTSDVVGTTETTVKCPNQVVTVYRDYPVTVCERYTFEVARVHQPQIKVVDFTVRDIKRDQTQRGSDLPDYSRENRADLTFQDHTVTVLDIDIPADRADFYLKER